MKPTWESEGVQLYLGDCLQVMPELAAGSVDAVVTDPPYGIGFQYAEHQDDPQRYEFLVSAFVDEAERLVKDGFVFVWQAMPHCGDWHRWFPQGFRVFAALKNFVQFRPTPVQFSWDPVIFWAVGKPDIPPVAGLRDYHMGNTAKYVAEKSIGHPCPRPLNTVSYIVGAFTRPGCIVLDPFMGSGTTGVACVQTGRKFIGIEISEQYFQVAVKRISEAQLQVRMPLDPKSESDGSLSIGEEGCQSSLPNL